MVRRAFCSGDSGPGGDMGRQELGQPAWPPSDRTEETSPAAAQSIASLPMALSPKRMDDLAELHVASILLFGPTLETSSRRATTGTPRSEVMVCFVST
jgi:hypothetical protein